MISIGGSGGGGVGGSGGVTISASSISHQGLVIGSGKDQVPVSEVADAVRFLAYLIKNHPEIKDAYTAFTAKERILR
jgi:hypothetical protein